MKNKGFFWHVHHDVLMEHCYDYKGRVAFIKANKDKGEIATRLQLFQPVKGKLPKELVEAGRKCDEVRFQYDVAWRKYVEAWRKYDEVRRKCDEAWRKYAKEIKILHEKECPNCPWDGKTIFPEEKAK